MAPIVRLPHAAVGMLLAVGSAQAADAVTFLRLMRDLGPLAEGNPWVASAASGGHLALLMGAKAGLVGLVVLVVGLVAVRYPLVGALVATVAVGAGLFGAWSNVLVLLDPFVG